MLILAKAPFLRSHLWRSVAIPLRGIRDMPKCDFKPSPYKGKSIEEHMKLRKAYITPAQITYYQKPVMIHQGHMQWLWDHTGRRYLDMFAGIVTVSVGHCHPKVTEAAEQQMGKLWHTTNIYLHPTIHEYAEQLAARLPGNLKVIYFVNSGSEANDLALYMARLYTGKFDIVSLRGCYHGMSPYLMGVTALNTWRHEVPSAFGVHHSVNPDPYRGPWGGSNCRDSPIQTDRKCACKPGQCVANDMYVEQLQDVVRHSLPKKGMAAFIAESIQGVGGTIQFPRDFIKRAYDVVKNSGGLFISDEVQTGFGRLGDHFWGFQSHGIVPDIVTMAKGIGNGYPMAAVVTTPEIAAPFAKALHFNTFGGNPVACAIGSAVLKVLDEDRCQERAADVGTYLLKKFAELRGKYEVIGDVRGKGLMIGVEMVTDKASRKPLDPAVMARFWEITKDAGVLFGKGGLYGNIFRIKPPMCITREDADFALDVFEHATKQIS